jgi:hypothetical protein
MKSKKNEILSKERFYEIKRLFEINSDEIEVEWNQYLVMKEIQLNINNENKRNRRKNKIVTKKDFINTHRLFETTTEEIENDWKKYLERKEYLKRLQDKNHNKIESAKVSNNIKLF